MNTLDYIKEYGYSFGAKKKHRLQYQAKKEIKQLRKLYSKDICLTRMILGKSKPNRGLIQLRIETQKIILRELSIL